MSPEETSKIDAYLKEKLNPELRLVARDKTADSLEVYLGSEFLALLFKIEEEGETSYQFQMTILKEDLE
ncbi:DUF3126 family protein [Ponticaulis sp.]|uniref:DUF3126 family protein n=1 Tax=Ponticaulis sp. TaxID=2020902 RepID=UPI000B6A7FBD|nr:DUF3126 family protein [Ponticaulis sp.]MAI89756.1 hypothetical protein [Ponticaulis sp.]OUY00769.1 MAG: hypothetical protein CBB65_04900 [Hyphomonadaceae bacterium TMED5]